MATAVDIVISAKDAATKAIEKVDKSIRDVADSAKEFSKKHEDAFQKAAVAGSAAFVGIAAVAKQTIDAYAESEQQLARVDAALRNVDYSKMGSSFDVAAQKAREFGDALQNTAGIGGEAGAESFAKLVQITGDYAEAQKLATLAADLSVAKQISMDSATKMVSMALAGNTKILKEYGIELDEGATKQQVIGAIMEKVGGQATAFGQTTAGQAAIMNESFGDLQETIGQALVPAFNQMMAAALPVIQSFTKWAAENQDLVAVIVKISLVVAGLVAGLGTLGLAIIPIISGINAAMSAFSLAITVVRALGVALTFLAANPIGLVITVLAALAMAMYYVYKNWDEIRPKLLALWTTIGGSISFAIETAKDAVGSAMDWMQSKVAAVTEWLAAKVNAVLGFAKTIRNALAEVGGSISGAVDSAGAAVGATISGARADGWPVSSGKTYVVGERGPELFTPSRSGTIIPNGGGSGGVTLTVNIGSVDASDRSQIDRLVVRLKDELTRELRLSKVWIS